jgi:hypothetical protein
MSQIRDGFLVGDLTSDAVKRPVDSGGSGPAVPSS